MTATEYVFALHGSPLDREALAAATEQDIKDGLAEGTIHADEIDEARAFLLKANRHVQPMIVTKDEREDTGALDIKRFTDTGLTAEHRWEYDPEKTLGELTFTHVVLFEGAPIPDLVGDPFYFGPHVVKGPFAIVCYDERTNTYRNIHCLNCAITIRMQINNMQATWRDKATMPGATHAPPQRLQ